VKRLPPLLVAALAALALLAVALAHAEPARITPGDGAVLASRPSQVEIEMSQELARQVGANDIDVIDASGKEVTAVAAVIDNANRRKISVPLPSDLPVGIYIVKWKTLSADDGDAASGQLGFTFDPARPPSPGKEQLREDLLGGAGASAGAGNAPGAPGGGAGISWVLLVAVAAGGLAIGGGATFLLFPRGP